MLPKSFHAAGLLPPEEARRGGSKFRGLMLATEGRANTGKTEFLLSAPGPGGVICCDRGFDAVFDNPTPPEARRDDFGFTLIKMSKEGQELQQEYINQWTSFRKKSYELMNIPELRTLGIDGDNVSYEVQRLGEHGKLSGVWPITKYGPTKATRRGFYHRLWDSRKIIIATNMLKEEWVNEIDERTGLPVKQPDGENKQRPSGEYVAQGFPDQEYLWQIRIRHLFSPAFTTKKGKAIPKQWGFRILLCKPNADLIGEEVWGGDACFAGLVQLVYPQVDLAEWGF